MLSCANNCAFPAYWNNFEKKVPMNNSENTLQFRVANQGPNLLVILRLILGPLAGVCLFAHDTPSMAVWAFVLYTLGWITDTIDGLWARSSNYMTVFGRAMDSVADKTLMLGFLVGLVAAGRLPEWTVSFFVFREMVLTGLRTIHMPSGQACSVNAFWGRIREVLTKIVFSSIGLEICLTHFGLDVPGSLFWQTSNRWLFYFIVAISLGTFLNYIWSDLEKIKEAMSIPE
jgi:CDP-diacylglycerol--glycerol-3-phosphate 3-phosphatidyltransferase